MQPSLNALTCLIPIYDTHFFKIYLNLVYLNFKTKECWMSTLTKNKNEFIIYKWIITLFYKLIL